MDDENVLDGEYNVNLAEVVAHKRLFAVTRLLATAMQQTPYIHPGLYVRDLADDDLKLLIEHANPDNEEFENLMLIALMLTTGEGIPASDKQMTRSINGLIVMLTSESLRRKGLIKVHHQNFSFGEDADNRLVIEKIEGIDYQKLVNRLEDGDDL